MESKSYLFKEDLPITSSSRDEIISGLQANPKRLSPKFFYDQRGSQLFDQICELPEYYLTRTEIGLLERYGLEISEAVGRDSILLELGSGSSTKIRLLLEAIRPKVYVPIDISKEHLKESADSISQSYPWLEVHALCADYSQPWELPFDVKDQSITVFFPGSSIGNFEPEKAIELLQSVGDKVGSGVGLLIGVDTKKDENVLNAAYNDDAGITAKFNKNLLKRINLEHEGGFDLQHFDHHAFYNQELGRIEMHLVSSRDQLVRVNGATINFKHGETLHTESSYKYHVGEFIELADRAGLDPVRVWQDEAKLFSIHYMQYR